MEKEEFKSTVMKLSTSIRLVSDDEVKLAEAANFFLSTGIFKVEERCPSWYKDIVFVKDGLEWLNDKSLTRICFYVEDLVKKALELVDVKGFFVIWCDDGFVMKEEVPSFSMASINWLLKLSVDEIKNLYETSIKKPRMTF